MNRKLTKDQVAEIKRLGEQGEPNGVIAKKYGCSTQLVLYHTKHIPSCKRIWHDSWEFAGDHWIIHLNRKGVPKGDVLVDIADKPILEQYRWALSWQGYAITRYDGQQTELHRVLQKVPEGMLTDHINRNKLDNRRQNLRFVGHEGNRRNTNTYDYTKRRRENGKSRGNIWWSSRAEKWLVKFGQTYLGRFNTTDEAELAIEAAIKWFEMHVPPKGPALLEWYVGKEAA